MKRRQNGGDRGNCYDRKARKLWLLTTFGDGTTVACRLRLKCNGALLTYVTLTVDRIVPGGSYRRDNIQPACKPCQSKQGNLIRRDPAHYADSPDNYRPLTEEDQAWLDSWEQVPSL